LLDAVTGSAQLGSSVKLGAIADALARLGAAVEPAAMMFGLLALSVGLFVLRSGLLFAQRCATAKLATVLRWRIKSLLFERFLRARYEQVSQKPRGQLMQYLTDVPEDLYSTIITFEQWLTGALTAAVMVGLLIYLSWWATLSVGLLAVGGVQGWRWLTERRAAECGRVIYGLRGSQTRLEIDAIDGLKVVKVHGLEAVMVARQQALIGEEYPAKRALVYCAHGPAVVNEAVGAAVVLLLGAATFFVPSAGVSFSMLVVFLVALRRIGGAMAQINTATVNVNRAKRGLEVIEDVFADLEQERRGGRIVAAVDEIMLRRVAFVYPSRPERRVLDGVSATMRRGAITALVGSTGSGKSTIANLLIGLYAPTAGAVLVNGEELRELDLQAWRGRIGYVSQDVFLFHASIRENITLGADVAQAQMEAAAAVAQFHEFVSGLPAGYDTVVGDRGLHLSGGQCQRLAIARAVLRRPEVLIFDEATSALDAVTERAVYDAISALRAQAVVVVIAHRLSSVRDADQILVLDSGRVVESGTHGALMERGGAYAKLYGAADLDEGGLVEESAARPSSGAAVVR